MLVQSFGDGGERTFEVHNITLKKVNSGLVTLSAITHYTSKPKTREAQAER